MPKTLPATKHFKLAQTLRAQIRRMQPGEPLPTVLQLRETFGVSQATVDRALDRLRREGLISRPAGQLRPVVSQLPPPSVHRIALIRPDYPSTTFEELSRVIVEAGKKKDWAFELAGYHTLGAVNLRQALSDCDGAILLPNSEEFPADLTSALRRPRRPVVLIQDPPAGLRVGSVRIDDAEVARLGVRHLHELGHRRILLVLSEPPTPSGLARVEGWRKQMQQRGETNLDELVVDCQPNPFDNSLVSSYRYLMQWLEKPHPNFTAAFCIAWSGAAAILRALREHHLRVPGDVSVVSHGGEGDLSPFLYPPLTAVETDLLRYGGMVVDLLEEQINDAAAPIRQLVVPSELVVRQSTARRK